MINVTVTLPERRVPDVIYTETPERYIEQRVKQHFAQYTTADVLLIVPQTYVWFKQKNVVVLRWGNLLPRGHKPRLSSEDLCLIYTTQEQYEMGQAYLDQIRDRVWMWGIFAPTIELVRKVVHA